MTSFRIGPAFLVTAAFIGPGTVITATLAGANFGFTLLWAVLFSVAATIVLQEMTARLGVVTQQGLGENIYHAAKQPLLGLLAKVLIVSAIVIGNGAYQSGNISGASLGLESLLGPFILFSTLPLWPVVIGLFAITVLYTGSYRVIERSLIALVTIMSIAFIITFILVKPNLPLFFSGLFIPSLPTGSILTVVALIGTTVVPYNLFLHSSIVCKKWHNVLCLPEARRDVFISIPLGGLITIAILSTAAAAFFNQQMAIESAKDIAPALQPLLGDKANIFIGIGLFAAGISSAITAPLAAAYALSGILNLNSNLHSRSFKITWLVIVLIGTFFSSLQIKSIVVIKFAQVTNGILLPLVVIFLIWIMNTEKLGEYKNTLRQNLLALLVLLVTLGLSTKSLLSAFNQL